MPGMSLISGTISHFKAGPAFRSPLVSGVLPGETAYTAMPLGSRRDLSLFQVNFYGFLQEFILREMEGNT